MAESSPQVASSASGVLSRSAGPSAALQAVSRVADEFGDAEIEPGISMQEALSDPNTRAQAARWRSGPEPRRATAILARMMQSLQSVRPSWTQALVAGELPVAEPLPVRRAGSSEALSWWRSSMNFCLFSTWGLRRSWRTWWPGSGDPDLPKSLGIVINTGGEDGVPSWTGGNWPFLLRNGSRMSRSTTSVCCGFNCCGELVC